MENSLSLYRYALERSRFAGFLIDRRVRWQERNTASQDVRRGRRNCVVAIDRKVLFGAAASRARRAGTPALRHDYSRMQAGYCTDQVLAQHCSFDFSEHKLRLATEVAGIGLFEYAVSSDELTWNDTMRRHFGLPPEAPVSTQTFLLGIHPEDRERVWSTVQAAYTPDGSGRYRAEYRTVGLADGKERWINSTGQVFFDGRGQPLRLIGSAIDITERRLAENMVREASLRDALTGLPNRALLFDYGERVLASAERLGQDVAIFFLDLDGFKSINDLHTHEAGDKLLQQVALRLCSCTRQEDIVCRLGGDEFILVLPRVGEASAPLRLAESILQQLVRPFEIGSLSVQVSASIGVSLYGKHGNNLETLIRCADLAMYAAKKHGRNMVQLYTEGLDERAKDRLQLEMRLRNAVHSGAMVLFYQPIVTIDSGELVGAEALVRLPRDSAAAVGPDSFIPVAESTGLIERIGDWVAHEACRQHRRWCEQGLPPLTIAINVSPVEFRQASFATRLFNTVRESGIDPQFLQIEVTESTLMDDLNDTIRTLNDIKSLGIKIALDDFGTGYSSLSYLGSLPLDKLKIDKSFIRSIESSEINQAITEAIIGLAKNLKLKVVGEGIESRSAMDYLRKAGCDQAQGYLFSEPLSGPDFAHWYAGYTGKGRLQATPSSA